MKLIKSLGAITVATVLAGGLAANSVFADLPSRPLDVRVMDTNKNGRIEKSEYLAFMGGEFDRLAGAKGYCTFAEVATGLRALSAIPDQSRVKD